MRSPPTNTTQGEAAVYATVAYSDVFDMPITLDHLHRFLVGEAVVEVDLADLVDSMVKDGRLACRGEVIYLPGRDDVLTIYDERTARAATMWREAERWGRRIGRVPFVRMVAVTGGLAVDSVADHDDIDYFIVTRPGRLWLTRLMIIALGRLAARHDIEVCPNYLVSDIAIEMSDQKIYVARELAQMVVIVGDDLCQEVRAKNRWMFDLLPNATVEGDRSHLSSTAPSTMQRFGEWVLQWSPFARLERWEMDRKIIKLTGVASRRSEVGAPDESSFSPDVCKGHMVGNAAGIDIAWKRRLADG